MKNKLYITLLPIIFLGCGGGGGSTPVPAPITPIVISTPVESTPINTYNWETEEYMANTGNNVIKAKGAYENGYTGQGIIVAVIDSGVDFDHKDLKNNIIEGRSFAAYTYDTSDGNFYYTNGGIGSDSIESIEYTNAGAVYVVAPTVTITGNGTGAEAVAVLNGDGTLEGIYMTNNGSGYTEANITISNGINVSKIRFGTDDDDGHGSAVAGVIAAEKTQLEATDPYDYTTHGVAFNASIMPIKVFDRDGYVSAYSIQKGIEYATDNNAKVINMSLGSNDINSVSSLKGVMDYALSKNSTFVISAGNEGLDCLPVAGSIQGRCSFPAALPWVSGYESLLSGAGGWVVVGSVDINNVISSFSNRAGVTKTNYLVAPGEFIDSTYRDNMGVSMSGTSISAPFVSGAMALMYEKYPHLNGNQLTEIFFSTATDLGAVGVDDIYGNGLINVEKAFSPIGELSIPSSNVNLNSASYVNNSTPIQKTSMNINKVFGNSLLKQKGLQNAVAFDSYKRDFNIDLTQNISTNNSEFRFENFSIMKFDNLLLGFDSINQKIMSGVNFGSSNLLFSLDNTLFNSVGEGAFELSGNTFYVSYNNKVKLGEELSLKYQFDYGYGNAKSNGLINNISSLHATGGSISLNHGDFGLIFEMPLAIQNGSMNFSIPVSRNIDGSVNYNNVDSDLSVSDREKRYGFIYSVKRDLSGGYLSFQSIQNINNIENNKFENLIKFNTYFLF